jgi:hypothetical protein
MTGMMAMKGACPDTEKRFTICVLHEVRIAISFCLNRLPRLSRTDDGLRRQVYDVSSFAGLVREA